MPRSCSWNPLAYKVEDPSRRDIVLRDHNLAVGASVYRLFSERLASSGILASPLKERFHEAGAKALVLAATLAGAIHDIGKASPYYKDRRGFSGHELLGAAVAYNARTILAEQGLWDKAFVLELASWAIARHHAAMKHRHPSSLEERQVIAALKALEMLREEEECLLQGLPRALPEAWRLVFLQSLRRMDHGRFREIIPRRLAVYNQELWRLPPKRWAAYVAATTGSLIVADILVASMEGRGTDEGAGPIYAEWWKRELGEGILAVKNIVNSCEEAEAVLSRALSPLF